MRYVILFTNGDVTISQLAPLADDATVSRVLPVENFTDALAIQSVVWKAFSLGDKLTMDERAALKSEIDEYKAINKSLVQRIDGLLGYQDVMQNLTNALVALSSRIMSQLAISTIIQMTHRERNEQIRSIVREIKYVLDKPVDQWLTASPRDMDDIPF